MARFYPLYVRRSDGKLEVVVKGKRKELNQPTDEQLDQKPDKNGVSDYYREVSPDEAKHLDWRRKLGGMLARELDWKDKNGAPGNENGYMLVAFPEHYKLYEHVKKTEKDGKTEVKNKTHAAGGNERQDAYLYGHPEGRRKRYRSPGDFFPHLLWLCTDETGDPDNCGCKICSPEDLDEPSEPRPVGRPRIKPEPEFKIESGQGKTKIKQEPGLPSQAPKAMSASRSLIPTPLALPKTTDQNIDLQYHSFMYRPGELVWFKRGQAWGLGGILRRWFTTSNQYHYTVQPLSQPFKHPTSVVKSSDAELRPWLAWSVPKYTNDGLNNMPQPPKYDTMDWQGMEQRRYGLGDMEVDGSILAAKNVDSSYTLFSPGKTTEMEPGVAETTYDGLFLGAEKIWVGDSVRLQGGSGTDIMVLHSVIERKRTSAMTPQTLQQSVQLIGDKYELQIATHSNPNIPNAASASNNPQLPKRLTEDLAYRNDRSIPLKHTISYWKPVSTQMRIGLDDVKGRWYEASLLLPILNPERFDGLARTGQITEASLWMNSRGDCLNSNRPEGLPRIPRDNILRSSRREAFGRAMPPNAEIKDGIEPPLPENIDPALESGLASQTSMDIDPRFDTADDTQHNTSSDEIRVARPEEEQGFDDFMNLDGIEDSQHSMPGFGKEYGTQSDGYY